MKKFPWFHFCWHYCNAYNVHTTVHTQAKLKAFNKTKILCDVHFEAWSSEEE
jgi:hypothetical protein